MMKKQNKSTKNYLDFIPVRKESLGWSIGDDNVVTLEIENKGLFNKIAQMFFKKPKISYVHLDEMGSFIWSVIDGEINIHNIGAKVKEHFGDKAEPLYERLVKYFKILESYGFISFKE